MRIIFQLTNINLADQRRNILIIFIARLGLGDGNLLEHRGIAFDDAKLCDVAIKFMQPLDGPGAGNIAQITPRNAVVLFEDQTIFFGTKQAKRGFIDR